MYLLSYLPDRTAESADGEKRVRGKGGQFAHVRPGKGKWMVVEGWVVTSSDSCRSRGLASPLRETVVVKGIAVYRPSVQTSLLLCRSMIDSQEAYTCALGVRNKRRRPIMMDQSFISPTSIESRLRRTQQMTESGPLLACIL